MITTIGCCDSGIGGLLVAHALKEAYPKLNIVFIADQAHVPYGDKNTFELQDYARGLLRAFENMQIQHVVVACNTLCADAIEVIRDEFQDLHIYCIIEPTCQQLANKNYQTINVLATRKTVETHIYAKLLSTICPQAKINEIAAPRIVPILENGADPLQLEKTLRDYCGTQADAWVLGCTHFSLLRPYLQGKGEIFDSNAAVVNMFRNEEISGEGKFEVYTSHDPERMEKSIQHFLGCTYPVDFIEL